MPPKSILTMALAMTLGVALPDHARAGDAPAEKTKEKAASASVEGNWAGALKIGAVELRLVVRISKDSNGALKGAMDSIDQGAKGIPIETITVTDRKVELDLKTVAGKFVGE